MIRWAICWSVVLGICVAASAADKSAYVLDVTATTQPTGKIAVTTVIRSASPDSSERMIHVPRLIIFKGQSGMMENTTRADKPIPIILSSTKVEVISMTSEDSVVIIATIIKNGQTIWADAKKIPVER
jgi:hypothetical protein